MRGLLILLGLFFVGLFVTGLISGLLNTLIHEDRSRMLWTSCFQNIFAFIIPALISSKIIYGNYTKENGLRNSGEFPAYIGIVVLFMIGLPFMNYIVEWNQNMTFPSYLSSLYDKLKRMEEMNSSLANLVLATDSVGGLVGGIIAIGIMTGFGEEIFFRGSLQTLLIKGKLNYHASIWISAILFSAIHFQFFGFVPRLLLGAWFGYLFYWTGSIWVAAAAHAVNNSMVVIVSWLMNRGIVSIDMNRIGINDSGFPLEAIVSILFFVITLGVCKRFYFKNKEVQ